MREVGCRTDQGQTKEDTPLDRQSESFDGPRFWALEGTGVPGRLGSGVEVGTVPVETEGDTWGSDSPGDPPLYEQ